MADSIKTYTLQNVLVQQNGIIRNSKGRLIAHLEKDIDFEGEHIAGENEPPTTYKQEPQKTEEIQESEMTYFERELAQAILSALEYRGFYDCGKYLDTSLIEYIKPILNSYTAQREQAVREEEREVARKILSELQHQNHLKKKGVVITNAHNGGYSFDSHQQRMDAEFDKALKYLTLNDTDKV